MTNNRMQHQYIDRRTGNVRTEPLFKDHMVNFFYSRVRENAGFCFNLMICGRSTALLSYLTFDFSFNRNREKAKRFIQELNIDMSETILPPERFFSARQVFERQIKYWKYRPMLPMSRFPEIHEAEQGVFSSIPGRECRQAQAYGNCQAHGLNPLQYNKHGGLPPQSKNENLLKTSPYVDFHINQHALSGTTKNENLLKTSAYADFHIKNNGRPACQAYGEHSCPEDDEIVVSPSDSKVLVGSLKPGKALFIKEKFFQYQELIEKEKWLQCFKNADFAIFRLTPNEYHYNHAPVSGKIADFYEISGKYHSCNPGAVVREVTPYSKNERVVTVINTDVKGGTNIGMVAMIEVTAMMIGRVDQCYSHQYYDDPCDMKTGMYIKKGQPKSIFRPGSSTVILLFEPGRIAFSSDIVRNMYRPDAKSRFTVWFGSPLVETSVRVREEIGCPV